MKKPVARIVVFLLLISMFVTVVLSFCLYGLGASREAEIVTASSQKEAVSSSEVSSADSLVEPAPIVSSSDSVVVEDVEELEEVDGKSSEEDGKSLFM